MPSLLSTIAAQRTEPLYLTNAICESAHGSRRLFKVLGLRSGAFDGDFYPLTEVESDFIADDAESFEWATLLFGYSVLLGGRKRFAPSVEFDCRSGDAPDAPTPEEARADAQAFFAAIKPMMRRVGGTARLQLDDGAHHTVMLLVPTERAMAYGSFAAWRRVVVNLVCEARAKAGLPL